jgi:5-methylcytosine-specific restriction endonuclease McrA
MPIPPSDNYLELMRGALISLEAGERTDADRQIRELAAELSQRVSRRPFTKTTVVAVLRRDNFTCRYCGGQVVPTPLLRAVSLTWPNEVPWNRNWRTDSTHPVHAARSGTIDHVEPHAHGGNDGSLTNLATACWTCNTTKSDFTLAQLGWGSSRSCREFLGWFGCLLSSALGIGKYPGNPQRHHLPHRMDAGVWSTQRSIANQRTSS